MRTKTYLGNLLCPCLEIRNRLNSLYRDISKREKVKAHIYVCMYVMNAERSLNYVILHCIFVHLKEASFSLGYIEKFNNNSLVNYRIVLQSYKSL